MSIRQRFTLPAWIALQTMRWTWRIALTLWLWPLVYGIATMDARYTNAGLALLAIGGAALMCCARVQEHLDAEDNIQRPA